MKAVVLDRITEAKDVVISEVPIPESRPGWVLVRVRAFGLNHSEKLLRLNEIRADYIQKPVIPGIECVGEIADPSDSGFDAGQKIVALMGGMGRSFNGSYAEYASPAPYRFPDRKRPSVGGARRCAGDVFHGVGIAVRVSAPGRRRHASHSRRDLRARIRGDADRKSARLQGRCDNAP